MTSFAENKCCVEKRLSNRLSKEEVGSILDPRDLKHDMSSSLVQTAQALEKKMIRKSLSRNLEDRPDAEDLFSLGVLGPGTYFLATRILIK